MSGTRAGIGRIVAIGIALALALLLLVAKEATAGKYSVAQCGWHIGADASWADTTGERSSVPTPTARPQPAQTPSTAPT